METPVLFLVFNRPDCTRRVFERIREARPTKLLVVADGPRSKRSDEESRCAEVRQIIDSGVDWPCEISRNYSEYNLGCAARVSSGLDWGFSREERLIVLEDDCLPNQSFFHFCEELLERYANNEIVGQICGCPRYFTQFTRPTSYIFSRYGPIWGWASWRRAWKYYDLRIKNWPELRIKETLKSVTQTRAEYYARRTLYDQLYSKKPTTWDYQWGYAKMFNNLLSAMPTVNLIENIGFDGQGTHYSGGRFGLEVQAMKFPLLHPIACAVDNDFDLRYAKAFTGRNLVRRALDKILRFVLRTKHHA